MQLELVFGIAIAAFRKEGRQEFRPLGRLLKVVDLQLVIDDHDFSSLLYRAFPGLFEDRHGRAFFSNLDRDYSEIKRSRKDIIDLRSAESPLILESQESLLSI